jgi:nicotinamidase-related amidase
MNELKPDPRRTAIVLIDLQKGIVSMAAGAAHPAPSVRTPAHRRAQQNGLPRGASPNCLTYVLATIWLPFLAKS